MGFSNGRGYTKAEVDALIAGVSGGSNTHAVARSATGHTTNTTGKMFGLARTLTPVTSGDVMVIVTGTAYPDTAGDGGTVTIYHGSGSAPAYDAALTGTAMTTDEVTVQNPSADTIKVPFCATSLITGLTLSTARWFDIALKSTSGGDITLTDVTIVLVEV